MTLTWAYFRAQSLSVANYMVVHAIKSTTQVLTNPLILIKSRIELNFALIDILILIFAILLMTIVHSIQKRYSISEMIRKVPIYCRWPLYYANHINNHLRYI